MKTIKLRFVRLPDDIMLWTHELIHQDDKIIVSKFKFSDLKKPSEIKEKVVVENGYTGICYDFLNEGYTTIREGCISRLGRVLRCSSPRVPRRRGPGTV